MSLNESIVEEAALEWFKELGYGIGHGPHMAPGEPRATRRGQPAGCCSRRERAARTDDAAPILSVLAIQE